MAVTKICKCRSQNRRGLDYRRALHLSGVWCFWFFWGREGEVDSIRTMQVHLHSAQKLNQWEIKWLDQLDVRPQPMEVYIQIALVWLAYVPVQVKVRWHRFWHVAECLGAGLIAKVSRPFFKIHPIISSLLLRSQLVKGSSVWSTCAINLSIGFSTDAIRVLPLISMWLRVQPWSVLCRDLSIPLKLETKNLSWVEKSQVRAQKMEGHGT